MASEGKDLSLEEFNDEDDDMDLLKQAVKDSFDK